MLSHSLQWRSRYQQRFASPQTVVVQPTTWCNLDCRYCYLPFRKLKHQMPEELAHALAQQVAQFEDNDHPIGIVWHGGEPLAVGQQKFAALLAPFEALRREGRIRHYVQTNATTLTDTWCDLLAAYDVRVGVSIDGPAAVNSARVDLRGKPAFDRTLRGIKHLREHGIPFSVISVVGTDGITMPEELLEFLATLGCRSAGFNIEEIEGANTDRPTPTPVQAEEFWRRTLAWTREHGGTFTVREVQRLAEYLQLIRTGQKADWDQPLAEIVHGAYRLRYVRDFLTGLDRCQAECEFFDFCRGAQASNRFFERQPRHHRDQLLPGLPAGPGLGPVRPRNEGGNCMTVLDTLTTSDAPIVMELTATHDAQPQTVVEARWDNRPTWDNWAKSPAPFDNRPTWDNWNKR